MSLLGFGLAPFGTSAYGYGQFDYSATDPKPALFQQLNGDPGQTALIDPTTGDYVVDQRGREIGTDNISIKVQLALLTLKNSSAVDNFGLDLSSLDIFKANTQSTIQAAIRIALSDLVKKKQISIQTITFQKKDLTAFINVKWINLITKKLQQTELSI